MLTVGARACGAFLDATLSAEPHRPQLPGLWPSEELERWAERAGVLIGTVCVSPPGGTSTLAQPQVLTPWARSHPLARGFHASEGGWHSASQDARMSLRGWRPGCVYK